VSERAQPLTCQGVNYLVAAAAERAGLSGIHRRWCTSPVRSDRVGSPLSGFNYPDAA
jgi:hypothetical protein